MAGVRGTIVLPYVLFLVGKDTHSDFVLKLPAAEEQLSTINNNVTEERWIPR